VAGAQISEMDMEHGSIQFGKYGVITKPSSFKYKIQIGVDVSQCPRLVTANARVDHQAVRLAFLVRWPLPQAPKANGP
jgi:hypothetical protein